MNGGLWWTIGGEPYDSLIINNLASELVTMSVADSKIDPENFNLHQNYPNPFNSDTK